MTDRDLKRNLIRSLAAEGINLLPVEPEPEVTEAALGNVRCRALASIVAQLINRNEPLLIASHSGAMVTVKERGGKGGMRFVIEPIKPEGKE